MTKEALARLEVRLLDTLLGAAILLLIGITGFLAKGHIDHERRVSVMEDNRFSNSDAKEMEARILDKMNLGPKWMVDRFELLQEQNRVLNQKMDLLNEKIGSK